MEPLLLWVGKITVMRPMDNFMIKEVYEVYNYPHIPHDEGLDSL